MMPGRPNGFGAPSIGLLALSAALALTAPSRVSAAEAPESPVEAPAPSGRVVGGASNGGWISIALLAGSTQFDAGLADYQWDTSPRFAWGVRALVGRGRFAGGLRVWRAVSVQSIGDLGEAPEVRATSWELVGEGRLAEVRGTRVLATAGAGRLHLGYEPDRITIQPPGAPSPIVVDLAPVGAWIGGAGLALRREVVAGWTAGLGVEARVFSIDTAHRAGNVIVNTRETFGDWSARFELARQIGRR
ncbi:MAG: hypothetical protein ACRENJ_07555 [Candidatus Eiseniibacteriota bacterium]